MLANRTAYVRSTTRTGWRGDGRGRVSSDSAQQMATAARNSTWNAQPRKGFGGRPFKRWITKTRGSASLPIGDPGRTRTAGGNHRAKRRFTEAPLQRARQGAIQFGSKERRDTYTTGMAPYNSEGVRQQSGAVGLRPGHYVVAFAAEVQCAACRQTPLRPTRLRALPTIKRWDERNVPDYQTNPIFLDDISCVSSYAQMRCDWN